MRLEEDTRKKEISLLFDDDHADVDNDVMLVQMCREWGYYVHLYEKSDKKCTKILQAQSKED